MRVELLIASNIWRFCRHFIIPREPGDQPSRLRLVVWKTTTQRRFRDVSLLPFHFIRRSCFLKKMPHWFKDPNGMYLVYVLVNLSTGMNSEFCDSTRRCCASEMIYATAFLLACKDVYLASLAYINEMYASIYTKKKCYFSKIAIGITFASYFKAHDVCLTMRPALNKQMSFNWSHGPHSLQQFNFLSLVWVLTCVVHAGIGQCDGMFFLIVTGGWSEGLMSLLSDANL